MTEKRFRVNELGKYNYSEIGEYIDENHTDSPLRNDELVELLNELHEENENLKQANSQLAKVNREGVKKVQKLAKENEQLKQINRNLGDFREFITEQNVSNEKQRKELQLQMLRLYNYFENYFEDTMSPNAFSEMWDNVKEDKKWEKR